jgi:hypothetical protein
MKIEQLDERNNGDSSALTPHSGEFFPKVHVYKDDQQFGTYSLEQIQTLLREGVVAAGDLAWVDGCESYMPIVKVSDLMVGLAASTLDSQK